MRAVLGTDRHASASKDRRSVRTLYPSPAPARHARRQRGAGERCRSVNPQSIYRPLPATRIGHSTAGAPAKGQQQVARPEPGMARTPHADDALTPEEERAAARWSFARHS